MVLLFLKNILKMEKLNLKKMFIGEWILVVNMKDIYVKKYFKDQSFIITIQKILKLFI